jgi:hypothetical protein
MQSCVVVKEYDKLYINDPDMKLAASSWKVRNYFQVYREAAAGANGGKQVVDVVVIKIIKWKIVFIMALLINIAAIAQVKDSTTTFKREC